MNNIKKTRAERPDKPIFFMMMGAFFVFLSLPAFYWANYNYGEYSRTTAFVADLQKKSDTDLTPTERQERGQRISSSNSRASRYLLEMALSGAGGLVLFGIALLLFIKAFNARNRKNFYERVDPRRVPLPNAPIKIEYKNIYGVLLWLILIFFVGIFLLTTYQNFSSRFITFENAVIRTLLLGVPIIFFLSIFLFLMLRARKNVVHLIDSSGVTRGDGHHFAWQDFCGVVKQTAFNRRLKRRYLWRAELAFAGGETTWIIPNRVKNYDEVSAYLDTLPPAVLKT